MSVPGFFPFVLRLAFAFASCVVSAAALATDDAAPAPVSAYDAVACADAARAAERARRFPLAVLRAVAIAESGRWRGQLGARIAWPWTVTAEGDGRYFATKAAAIGHVQALRRDGVRSIDVGCMQINLMHHPRAFETLEDAFDPVVNAAYAGVFLARLYDRSRSWSRAVASYHSARPGKGRAYWRRVQKVWNAERARLFEQARRTRIREFRGRRAAGLARAR